MASAVVAPAVNDVEVAGAMVFDPILHQQEGEERSYCLFPIRYPRLFHLYKQACASFWTADELDLSRDRHDFERLTEPERTFLKHVLAFFASADGIVNDNLATNFSAEVLPQEILSFYSFQSAIEAVHAETYSLLIDTLIGEEEEKTRLFRSVETMPVVAKKAAWMRSYMSVGVPFEERLVAFSCAEGLLFSASFASVFFFKRRGLMPGLCFSNELISRDEALHCTFAVELHDHLRVKATPERITEIVRGAVEVECAFVREALAEELLGMNADSMQEYVKFVADRLLAEYGCDKVYQVQNPYPWMAAISLSGIQNFFEGRSSAYAKAGVGVDKTECAFSTQADF